LAPIVVRSITTFGAETKVGNPVVVVRIAELPVMLIFVFGVDPSLVIRSPLIDPRATGVAAEVGNALKIWKPPAPELSAARYTIIKNVPLVTTPAPTCVPEGL